MPVDIRMRFGRAIRRIREEQEVNQEEAAERCGLLHRTYYSGIERGMRNILLLNNIERAAKGLKTSPLAQKRMRRMGYPKEAALKRRIKASTPSPCGIPASGIDWPRGYW